jgi:hypothetical protein
MLVYDKNIGTERTAFGGTQRMYGQIAELEPGPSVAVGVAASTVARPNDYYPQERPLLAARGIINGVLIATPFWILFALALYLLI